MKVIWSGKPSLQISSGDLIQILSGHGNREGVQIEATRIRNKTTGAFFESDVHGILSTRKPHDFTPPLLGYAKYIQMSGIGVVFELEEIAPPIVSGILRECAKFIDSKLYGRCKDKDYHDVVTNAFPILEDRIRAKIGVDTSYSGQKLIDYAFNPKNGRLMLGKISNEQQALYLLFKGAIGFLRNPPSHSLTEDESNIEAFELICMVDLLLRIVDKAELRS
ncbi:MAG: TIGR02391 family protein [Candidatus Bathyarchaeota archaeon]|nr:TIGR02391 family protein [Candidatus Bathyarchaeota archaeon]MDH5745795.1 TIGR02391 family protein [Candidatus Bathyarchaeota archaeon]